MPPQLAPDDPRHGTTHAYRKLGCRCDRCREANRVAKNAYMAARPEQRKRALEAERLRRDPTGEKERARERQALKRAEDEARKRQLELVHERIRALSRDGWTYGAIARRLNDEGVSTRQKGKVWHKTTIWHIVNDHRGEASARGGDW